MSTRGSHENPREEAMSSLQEKKYLRLIKFSLDLSLKVSRAFTTSNVLHNYNNSLAVFLTTHQHDIYHLWIPDTQCCCCTGAISLKSKPLLYKPQFDQMFIMTGQINHSHVQKDKSNKNKVKQHCVCNIAANPTCTLDKLDIVILCRIVRNCFKLQPDEDLWLDTISKIRNELAHVADISNFKNGTLEHWWTQLEGSVLGLSRKVPPDLYYHEAIQGQVSLLQIVDFESSGAQEVLDKLKSDNAKLMADMKDELNNWYVTQESFEILGNAVIATKNETEAQLRHLMDGQEAAASQASHLQNMIVNENNNMKEVQERQFQSFKESQSEIKREVSEIKGEMNSRLDRLEIMVQAILQNQQMSSPEAAEGVGRTHDVGCKAHGGDIDYDKVITELQNEEPINDEARAFKINSARTGSILLDLTCSHEVLKSEANLRGAILNLVDRIVKAGNIDTNTPGTMNIELTFKGPLTEEEARVLSTVFSTKEDNQECIVIQKKAEESHAGNDEHVAGASFLDKTLENMVYCKNCNACFVCDNCDLKDRQILDLMEIKSQEKKTKYDYETKRKDKQFHTVENKYTDWMKLHLENLQKEEKTLERDVANCGSLRSRMSEEIEKDKKSRYVDLEKEKILNTLHKRYSNICNQLETKSQQVKYHQFALDEYLSKEVEKDHDLPDEIDISIKKGHHPVPYESKLTSTEFERFHRTDSEEDPKYSYTCTQCDMVLGDVHSYWCNECSKTLCENCHTLHQKSQDTTNHQTIQKMLDNISYKLEKSFTIQGVHISDMKVLGGNLLVIADRDHNQLLTYSLSGQQRRSIAVTGKPNRLAVVNNDQVAVTLPHEDKISIVDVRRGNVVKSVCVKGVYWAIAYYGGELYVSCDSFKIKIIDLNGRVKGLIPVKGFIPSNVCFSASGKLFCIDNAGSKLLCFDRKGDTLFSFSTSHMKGLWSIAVDMEENLIVTDKSQFIHKVSPDGTQYETIADTHIPFSSIDIVATTKSIVLAEHDGYISVYRHI